ncbi:putative RNase H-like nuclease (RuvC/YqgF family) [Methanococcus maripaludis]|uniref:Putative RNase H-like nuclease (RuvC/YqgF family) n=1 Tax=Methanococcus maripaludis TaxID=39152 RepID=A0A7J9NXA2_METMI|nr:hypothetical protein [Methanococcus maripaludis]MBA2851643.1 putative RNase H-like nuclease (RuvC/YqgF family) [Methanococcus maripaludis]
MGGIIKIPETSLETCDLEGNIIGPFGKYDAKEVGKAVLLVKELENVGNSSLVEKLQSENKALREECVKHEAHIQALGDQLKVAEACIENHATEKTYIVAELSTSRKEYEDCKEELHKTKLELEAIGPQGEVYVTLTAEDLSKFLVSKQLEFDDPTVYGPTKVILRNGIR